MKIEFQKPEGWVPPPPALPPDAYCGKPDGCRQGQKFVPSPRRGYTVLKVLPFLTGKPWDEVALGFVQALRPSTLRVIQREQQCDAEPWRVTVDLKADGKTIRSIEQEVEVGLPKGIPHGQGLHTALKCGMDSKEMEWENLEADMTCYDHTGVYKLVGGKAVYYPKQGHE